MAINAMPTLNVELGLFSVGCMATGARHRGVSTGESKSAFAMGKSVESRWLEAVYVMATVAAV